jgi:hypothetical protein
MLLSKKPKDDLSDKDMKYLKAMHTKIKNKLTKINNELHLHAHDKYSNLKYRGAVSGGKGRKN